MRAPRSPVQKMLWLPGSNTLAALATLVVGVMLTLAVTQVVQRSINSAAQERFNALVSGSADRIVQRMQAYEQILKSGVALFATEPQVSRQQWHDFVLNMDVDANFPGIQGIGYTEYILPRQLAAHEARVRAEGFPSYHVRPVRPRDDYSAIVFLEPFTPRNQRAFGFDMYSEPVRRQAMATARDTGRAALSGKVKLVQETETDVQAGVLLYQPLYAGARDPGSLAARRATLRGWVYAPFRVNNLMRGVLGSFDDSVELQVFDGTSTEPDALLYHHHASALLAHAGRGGEPQEVRDAGTPQFYKATSLQLNGRTWTLVMRSTPLFEARTLLYVPNLVLAAGLLISLLFAGLVWSLISRRQFALQLADEATGALRQREAFISAVVDNAADAIITVDQHGQLLSLNKAAERIFGFREAEVLGRSLSQLLPDALAESDDPAQLVGQHILHGQRRNGERFALELALSAIDAGGQRAWVAIARDISERLRAEEQLRRSEERLHLAFTASSDGLWDWNLDNDRVYYSPTWGTMLGYEPDEVPHTLAFWEQVIHPDDEPQVRELIKAYVNGEVPSFWHEHRLRRKDGSYMWILARAFAQRDEHGRAFRLVGTNADIDQRKQVEQMKNQFISIISHELRTPVTSIYGSIMLLKQKALARSEVENTLISMALRNSTNLLTLLNDLLDMDKIQSGRLEMHLEPVNVWPLLQEACGCNAAYAEQYGVSFELQPAPEELWVMADPTRLQQVITNLLSNAAKFSPRDASVTISMQRYGERVRISVADQGEGIPAAFRSRIFSKFSQADSSASRPRNGSGLGLNISRSIVEALQGEISFDSVEGEGTEFHVDLPLLQAPSAGGAGPADSGQ